MDGIDMSIDSESNVLHPLTEKQYLEKFRHGSVLSRGTILKADQFSAAHNIKLNVHVVGAPNFRGVSHDVYGVSQPTVEGIAGILTLLGSQSRPLPVHSSTAVGLDDDTSNTIQPSSPHHTATKTTWCCMREEPMVYINGRTYVLRDHDDPLNNIRAFSGIDASRLEQMEERLRNDILREATHNSQFILVHDEVDKKLLPCWIAVKSVRTSREVYQMLQKQGYHVQFCRIPIAAGQGPEDAFFDAIFDVIWNASQQDRLIFNCQQGRGRTTIGMVIALLVRRARDCQETHRPSHFLQDPRDWESNSNSSRSSQGNHRHVKTTVPLTMDANTHILLRLMHVLAQAMDNNSNNNNHDKTHPRSSPSAMDWALARGHLMEDLTAALQGNYCVILQLLRVLDQGNACKALLDRLIDDTDAVIHLRESILMFRVQPTEDDANLHQAATYMERYLCLVAFTAYLYEHLLRQHPSAPAYTPFSTWLSQRVEISTMLHRLRHRRHHLLAIFRPLEDLSARAATTAALENDDTETGMHHVDSLETALSSLDAPSSQRERLLVRHRTGAVLGPHTILKLDHWRQDEPFLNPSTDALFSPAMHPSPMDASKMDGMDGIVSSSLQEQKGHHPSSSSSSILMAGAPNFRRVVGEFPIYGTAQPTVAGLRAILHHIQSTEPQHPTVCWVNLREEPLVYVDGEPFVLRDAHATLRNIRTITGISGHRLETMEEKLRDDVLSEMRMHDGQVLVHHETNKSAMTHRSSNDTVVVLPEWKSVTHAQVQTCQDVVQSLQQSHLEAYVRIPITAEESFEDTDFDALLRIMRAHPSCAFLFNCQVGAGRSTMGTIVAYLILRHDVHRCSYISSSFHNSLDDLQGDGIREGMREGMRDGIKDSAREGTFPVESPLPPLPSITSPSSSLSPPSPVTIDEHLDSAVGKGKDGLRSQYVVILALLRVLRHGDECRHWVDEAIDRCSQTMHLTQSIDRYRVLAQQHAADELVQRSYIKKALALLRRYFDLLCFQAYLNDAHAAASLTLRAWKTQHLEILHMQQKLDSVDLASIIPVHEQKPQEGFTWTHELGQVLHSRHGSILAPNTILKSDHFPGSQRLDLKERITDAPNFRGIPLGDLLLKENNKEEEMNISLFSVYGVGMPTREALQEILSRIHAPRRVLWICLREEPVLYIHGRPYVLRNWQEPLKNLESTGIARHRLETMEARMKRDVLKESERYGGRVLVHTEEVSAAPSQGVIRALALFPGTATQQQTSPPSYAVVPIWETVTDGMQVQTMKEVFDALSGEVEFVRIPMTDEQAPIPVVFDELLLRIRENRGERDIVFNCQLGRGRTTTGMVIVCLYELIGRGGSSSTSTSSTTSSSLATSAGMTVESKYLRGEYKSVLSVLRVLPHGSMAKQWVDRAIDMCSHLQNLREAIYLFKRRLDTLSRETDTYAQMLEWALNYLYRYIYLIMFAEYLLEEMGNHFTVSFADWLQARKELSSLLDDARKDLDY